MKIRKMTAAVILICGVVLAGCSAKTTDVPETKAETEFTLGDAVVDDNGSTEILYQAVEEETGEGLTIVDGAVPLAGASDGNGFDRGREEVIIELVNEERARNGLGSVSLDETLMLAAEVRAEEQRTLFSHTRPDGSDAFTVFKQFGIPANYRGENVAYGDNVFTDEDVMEHWMNSEGHKRNILDNNFARIGVGYFEANGKSYWCQLFAN